MKFEEGVIKNTDAFIRCLAHDLKPVRPLPHPWIRTLAWLALAIPAVALVAFLIAMRRGLPSTPLSLPFVVEQVAALATGATAAMAAFASIVPGYNRKLLFLPALPIAAWLGSVGQGCLQDWIRFGSNGLLLQPDWICLPVIALMGTAPAIAMAVMLRRGAPLRPNVTTALGGLAAAGLGNFGLRFVHVQDASVMVLVWQCGAVFALSALAGWAGPSVLNWRSVVGDARLRALVE